MMTTMTMMIIFLTIFTARAENVELASLLIKDGQFDQARQVLAQIDLAQEKDLATYYQLQGMVKSHLQDFPGAIDAFNLSFEQGQTNLLIHVYLAQAHLALSRPLVAKEHLERSGPIGKQQPLYYLLASQCEQKLGHLPQALGILQEGLAQFPSHLPLHQSLISFYVHQGLLQMAMEIGQKFLYQYGAPENYALVAQIFHQASYWTSAVAILEQGKLLYPDNENLVLSLVQLYYQRKKPWIAAQILENYVLLHPQFYPQLAKLYQLAGQRNYALYLNSRVIDQEKKYQQRFGLLLAQEKFEQLAQMEAIWHKHQALGNDESKYALAYSFFKIGNFAKMEQYLGYLTQEELFMKAMQMRKSAELCREQAWACF